MSTRNPTKQIGINFPRLAPARLSFHWVVLIMIMFLRTALEIIFIAAGKRKRERDLNPKQNKHLFATNITTLLKSVWVSSPSFEKHTEHFYKREQTVHLCSFFSYNKCCWYNLKISYINIYLYGWNLPTAKVRVNITFDKRVCDRSSVLDEYLNLSGLTRLQHRINVWMNSQSVIIISGVCLRGLHPTVSVNFLSTNLYIPLYGEQMGENPTQIQASYCHTGVAGWWVQWSLGSGWGCGFGGGNPSGAVCPTLSSSRGGAAANGWPGCCCGRARSGWAPGALPRSEPEPACCRRDASSRWGCRREPLPRSPRRRWCPHRTAAGRCSGGGYSGGRGTRRCRRPRRSSARWTPQGPWPWVGIRWEKHVIISLAIWPQNTLKTKSFSRPLFLWN